MGRGGDGHPVPRVVMKKRSAPREVSIQDMAVVFNPALWLPSRLEYFGNLDPAGFALVEYNSINSNVGLKEEELKF
jgi:hypothetical protein